MKPISPKIKQKQEEARRRLEEKKQREQEQAEQESNQAGSNVISLADYRDKARLV